MNGLHNFDERPLLDLTGLAHRSPSGYPAAVRAAHYLRSRESRCRWCGAVTGERHDQDRHPSLEPFVWEQERAS